MIKATLYTEEFFLNNRQFDIHDTIANRDNCLFPFYLLKQNFAEQGVDLSTQDINKPEDSRFIIYNEMPKINEISPHKENYLIIFESDLIRPQNWNIENHKFFKKIFTWHDDFVDGKKYIKIHWPQMIPATFINNLPKEKKLCTLIASNKFYAGPNELYSERVNAIRWFENHYPKDFDLYGMGWDFHFFSGPFSPLNQIKMFRQFLRPIFSSYKGSITNKEDILKNYKFSICYENVKNTKGYITEKIFDCFFSGCVPIYLGAPNITDYVPADTFIDKRKFCTYEDLYAHLKNISDLEYLDYLHAIKSFVEGDKIYPFKAEFFGKKIVNEIICVEKY